MGDHYFRTLLLVTITTTAATTTIITITTITTATFIINAIATNITTTITATTTTKEGKKCFFIYGYIVKDHPDSERGDPLPPHRLLLSINSKGSFICTIPQTG